jgi:hypothetical protein
MLLNSPPAECLAAVKLLIEEHRDSIAFYKPNGGGLVLVIDDKETEEAIVNFIRALDGIQMEGAEMDLLSSVLGIGSDIPEA